MNEKMKELEQREAEIRRQMADYNIASADLRIQMEVNQREVCRLSRELTEIHNQYRQLAQEEAL